MRKLAPTLLLMATLAGTCVFAGETIERAVAIINGHTILLSEWDSAVRIESLIEGRPPGPVTGAQRWAALQRLIDQELLREELESAGLAAATKEAVQHRLEEIRAQYKTGNKNDNEDQWQAVLDQHGVQSAELEQAVALQLSELELIDYRLRPSVAISDGAIRGYYRDTYEPQMEKAGAKVLPLTEVSAKIREILTQQKMNEGLANWLLSLRAQSDIRLNVSESSEVGQSQ